MKLLLLALLLSQNVFAVGSVTTTRYDYKNAERVDINWVADAADGSVPNKTLGLYGYIVKIVTNPGTTAPTANYDMTIGDTEDSALDILGGALANRHTTTTEQVYPLIAGTVGTVSSVPVFAVGTYTFALANNSVNSATGRVSVYLAKP